MGSERVYNFSAGPSMLPLEILEWAGVEITNYQGSGASVMETGHRSKVFQRILDDIKARLRALLNVPEGYQTPFLQGGTSTQLSMAPLNPIGATDRADYAVTGNSSNIAYREAQKYGQIHLTVSSADKSHTYIPQQSQLELDSEASYLYYCINNTIYGTEWQCVPEANDVLIACDISSDILSRPMDVSKYGVIFTGVQKNMAPTGLTMVAIKEELVGHELPFTPLTMNYETMADKDSMYSTLSCWCIYMPGLILDWLEEQGGTSGMEAIKHKKAQMPYDVISSSQFPTCAVEPGSCSDMNVMSHTGSNELDVKFVQGSVATGPINLGGYRSVSGIRASIYDATPAEGVEKLCDFIKAFSRTNQARCPPTEPSVLPRAKP